MLLRLGIKSSCSWSFCCTVLNWYISIYTRTSCLFPPAFYLASPFPFALCFACFSLARLQRLLPRDHISAHCQQSYHTSRETITLANTHESSCHSYHSWPSSKRYQPLPSSSPARGWRDLSWIPLIQDPDFHLSIALIQLASTMFASITGKEFLIPSCLNFWSFGQVFVGHLYRVSTTLTKPASSKYFLYKLATVIERPILSHPSMLKSDHRYNAEVGTMDPSSESRGKHLSASSMYPPGLRFLSNMSIFKRLHISLWKPRQEPKTGDSLTQKLSWTWQESLQSKPTASACRWSQICCWTSTPSPNHPPQTSH